MQEYYSLLVNGYTVTIQKTERGYKARVAELKLSLFAPSFELAATAIHLELDLQLRAALTAS